MTLNGCRFAARNVSCLLRRSLAAERQFWYFTHFDITFEISLAEMWQISSTLTAADHTIPAIVCSGKRKGVENKGVNK